MKQEWLLHELHESVTLSTDKLRWLSSQAPHNQLGLAVLLKVFQFQGFSKKQFYDQFMKDFPI